MSSRDDKQRSAAYRDDLTATLRALSRHEHSDTSIGAEAADEIERLERELAEAKALRVTSDELLASAKAARSAIPGRDEIIEQCAAECKAEIARWGSSGDDAYGAKIAVSAVMENILALKINAAPQVPMVRLQMADESAVVLSAKLYECRRVAKTILGSKFADRMDVYGQGIRAMGEVKKLDTLGAALELIKKTDSEFEAICILAAAVEIVEPSVTARSGDAHG